MGIVAKNSPYIMGIDLGTSNSAVAFYHKGKSEVVQINGEKCLPSVINVRDNGEIVVGHQAKAKMLVDLENTVASIKREMGNPSYKKEFKGLPGKQYTPADISAEILSKLKEGAEQSGQFDLRGSLKYAVICVPANFDDNKKQATLEAGRLANLEVLYLLEEPVAAAIAYGLEKEREQTILVYDLGGGTFDVSILQVNTAQSDGKADFKVLAKEGIPLLGGDDFDKKIMEIVANDFKGKSNLDLFDLQKDQGLSKKALREAQQKLKDAAETAKKELSPDESKSTQITIPSFLKDESGQMHHLDMELTKVQFEDAIKDLVAQSKGAVEKALQNAKLNIDDISRIILVGGSTRVPLVKKMLSEMFGKEPYSDLDPDTIVAQGAAIYGATLGVPTDKLDVTEEVKAEDLPDVKIVMENIVSHFLGIEVTGGRFSKLIDKGIKLNEANPVATNTKEYTTPRDNMTELTIRVWQMVDEQEYVFASDTCVCLGEFFLTGIPPAPRGKERITVTFEIDQQNLLKVTATSKGDLGISKTLEIKRS